MKLFDKELLVVLLIGLLVGCIFYIPNLISRAFVVDNNFYYSPFSENQVYSQDAYEEMYTYAPEVQEILKTGSFLRDPYTFENRNLPSPFVGQSLPAVLSAILAKIFGSVANAFVVGDFIFPVLIFYILYFLIKNSTGKTFISIISSLSVIFFWEIMFYLPRPQLVWSYFFDVNNKYFLSLMRSFNPQISFFVFILACYLLILILNSKLKYSLIVLTGIVSGLLFYTYIYYWMAFFMALFFLLLLLFLGKQYSQVFRIILVFLVAFIVGLYYFYSVYLFRNTLVYSDFSARISPVYISNYFIPVLKYAVIAVIYLLWPRKRTILDWFILSLLLSSLLLYFILRPVLGQSLQEFHFIRRVFFPISVLGFGILMSNIIYRLEIFRNILKYIKFFLVVFILFTGIFRQVSASLNTYWANIQNIDSKYLFDWLNTNTSPNSVIVTDVEKFGYMVSANTHNCIYIPPVDLALLTTKEINERREIVRSGMESGSWNKKYKINYLLLSGDRDLTNNNQLSLVYKNTRYKLYEF